MTSQTLIGALLVLMTGFGIPALGAQSARDEAEIRDLQARQQEAWNRHDAKAYAALFTEDGDVVNVVGWWWKGRSEIETQLTAAYAVVFLSRLSSAYVPIIGVPGRMRDPSGSADARLAILVANCRDCSRGHLRHVPRPYAGLNW